MLTAIFRYGVLYLFMAVKLYQVLVLSKPLIRWHNAVLFFFLKLEPSFKSISIIVTTLVYGKVEVWQLWTFSLEMQFSHLSRSSSLKYRSHPFFTVMCSGNWYNFLLSLNKYPLHETWLGFKPLFCLKAHFDFFSPMINKCWVKSIAFFFILTCFIQSKSMWKFKLLLLNDPYTSSSLWCWPVEGATAKCVAEWATSRWTHHNDFHDDGGTSSTNSFWTVWTLLSNDGGIIYERTALDFQDSCV